MINQDISDCISFMPLDEHVTFNKNPQVLIMTIHKHLLKLTVIMAF